MSSELLRARRELRVEGSGSLDSFGTRQPTTHRIELKRGPVGRGEAQENNSLRRGVFLHKLVLLMPVKREPCQPKPVGGRKHVTNIRHAFAGFPPKERNYCSGGL